MCRRSHTRSPHCPPPSRQPVPPRLPECSSPGVRRSGGELGPSRVIRSPGAATPCSREVRRVPWRVPIISDPVSIDLHPPAADVPHRRRPSRLSHHPADREGEEVGNGDVECGPAVSADLRAVHGGGSCPS